MESIQVKLKNNSYTINIGENILEKASNQLSNREKWLIVTDNNVDRLYGKQLEKKLAGYNIFKYVVPPGEESKTPQVVIEVLNELLKYQFTRQDKIIALGGGVIGDLAGFCASTYMRGISFVQIPTTLLAQVDSSVGGKTAVNLPKAKNIMGAFHQPQLVIADTSVLKTLPRREIISGLGEVIKYGIIEDYDFFTYIHQHMNRVLDLDQNLLPYIVKSCCEIKANIVGQDEKEKGLRKNLNFGHTFGHAIETITKYKQYTHGEAVIIGMYYEAKIAEKMGLIDKEYTKEIGLCLNNTGVSLGVELFSKKELVKIMARDKKNKDNKISFILPVGKGRVQEFFISEKELLKIISEIMKG